MQIMALVRIVFFLFIFLTCATCTSKTAAFYTNYVEDNLYRIPLIYPYKLIRIYGLEKDEGSINSWDLEFHYNGDSESPGFSSGVW